MFSPLDMSEKYEKSTFSAGDLMASFDMIHDELQYRKKLGSNGHVEYYTLRDFGYRCEDGQVYPIAYPTNTSTFVIPLHTVGVMAFVLYYLKIPNFLEHWVVYFPTEISDRHFYMSPFHKCEEDMDEKHYKYNWRKNMKNRLKEADFWDLCNQCLKTTDQQQHALAIFDEMENESDRGGIVMVLKKVTDPQGNGPRALFRNIGGFIRDAGRNGKCGIVATSTSEIDEDDMSLSEDGENESSSDEEKNDSGNN